MNSEVLLGFSKPAFYKKITSDFENRSFRHFSMKLYAFCDQLMQVYTTLTPFMLFRSSNFIPFLRTSGLKKSIILGNKIKVKTNFWILLTCMFTYIQSVNLACVFNSYSAKCDF